MGRAQEGGFEGGRWGGTVVCLSHQILQVISGLQYSEYDVFYP